MLTNNKEKPVLEYEERISLESLQKKWKYICRNKDQSLALFNKKPDKMNHLRFDTGKWGSRDGFYPGNKTELPYPQLFKFIKWKDDEPMKVTDILDFPFISAFYADGEKYEIVSDS